MKDILYTSRYLHWSSIKIYGVFEKFSSNSLVKIDFPLELGDSIIRPKYSHIQVTLVSFLNAVLIGASQNNLYSPSMLNFWLNSISIPSLEIWSLKYFNFRISWSMATDWWEFWQKRLFADCPMFKQGRWKHLADMPEVC